MTILPVHTVRICRWKRNSGVCCILNKLNTEEVHVGRHKPAVSLKMSSCVFLCFFNFPLEEKKNILTDWFFFLSLF